MALGYLIKQDGGYLLKQDGGRIILSHTFGNQYVLNVDTLAFTLTFNDVGVHRGYNLMLDTLAFTLTLYDITFARAMNLVLATLEFYLTYNPVILLTSAWSLESKPSSTWTEDSKL